MPYLEVDDLHVGYGQIAALKGVSLSVEKGQLVTLVGANGAGKTTLLRTISGLLRPSRGSVNFDGQRIDAMEAHKIAGTGLVQVPEGRRIFGRLTVSENLELGAFTRNDKAEIMADKERMMTVFPRLKERFRQLAGTLSGGEQQMVATARALMARPKALLMDEPTMGLSPIMVEQVFDTIQTIHAQGVTILLVEQNALMALSVADYGYVLESGHIVLEGQGDALVDDERVRHAYLG
ncbi:amino acid/amide ABC transporter ATP-binding protein 2, HAAT family [Arboricoccus pini]|uniref:Amino acid/amide ABC transporter ATP-binding protein 2, HAAT family n=1 Tax=Arboricoccus pini TaxID=1963835 RepID=A0A212RIN8_9PROT|nr:ABC transporter ATP-binding protein [Arboricoccus pini]SNB72229.1 amino acid/amide ABC transporter ATP-binding protein 2, HAAT family [Arboricoccus pini]